MDQGYSFPQSFRIGEHWLGAGHPCFVIAEVAQAHDGSLGFANSFIDAAADAGANAIKFQTHIASAESTHEEKFRVKFTTQDATRFDYWRRMQFTEAQWQELAQHAHERGLAFLSSPFSMEALEMLERIGVPAWKVASGETNNSPMLQAMVDTGKPVLLSTGMSYLREIDEAVALVGKAGVPLAVFQCTNRYPCPPEHLGLNLVGEFIRRYGCPIGLSDHTGQPWSVYAAVALGCDVVEAHVAFHRTMFGPDVPASLTFEQLAEVVEQLGPLRSALAHPVDKDQEASELEDIRGLFTKSVVPVQDLPAGTVIQRTHVTFKKPGRGIPAREVGRAVGMRLKRSVKRDELFQWDDLEEPTT